MKKSLRLPVYVVYFLTILQSCSSRQNNERQVSASQYAADTTQVRMLLDSFSYYRKSNEVRKILPVAEKAYSIAERAHYEDGLADAMTALCSYYSNIGDHPKAMQYSLRALEINEKNKNDIKIAKNLLDIGLVHYLQKNFSEAVNYYQKAVRIQEKLNNKSSAATLQYLIGLIYFEMKKDSLALAQIQYSLKTQQQFGETQRVAECEKAIGDIYLDSEEYEQAQSYYDSSLVHFKKAGEAMGAPIVNISLAKLYMKTGQLSKAEISALRAADYLGNNFYNSWTISAYDILHQVYASEKKYDKAYDIQAKLVVMRDSVLGAENASKISFLETSYELEKKQNEIELQQKQIKTTSTLRNFFMAGFAIVALLAFLTFLQYKMKNKTAKQLEETIVRLQATQEQLVYTEKISSLGKLSAGIAHEIQNPLNFVNNFSDIGISLIEELKTTSDEKERNEILQSIKGNLQKINEHGRRADGIVKSMLDHTHIGSREKRPTDLSHLANEFFTLAYESFKAKEPGFTCHIEKLYGAGLPQINVNPQDISRVMINLFNNALFALNKRKLLDGNDFSPTITLKTHLSDNKYYFSVKDNGTGIPDELRGKIFQPFFTTKSSGEGTGLGLSLSHEIIVQGHGGTLEMKSVAGEGSEFIMVLPV